MNFQDLGATGIIGIVILAFAVIGFLKGLIRTVFAMVCLGIAGYAALWGHEHASDLTGPWISNPGPWLPKIIAIATGLIVFFLCRFILNFLVDPFNRSKTGERIGFGIPAAALSLCAGLGILWLAFTGIRYGGSLAELRHTQHQILGDQITASTATAYASPLLMKAKQALDASSVGKWHQLSDPFHTQGKVVVCKILIAYHNSPARDELSNHPTLAPLLRHPKFLELAYQQEIINQCTAGNPRDLFSSRVVETFLKSEGIIPILGKVAAGDLAAIIVQ